MQLGRLRSTGLRRCYALQGSFRAPQQPCLGAPLTVPLRCRLQQAGCQGPEDRCRSFCSARGARIRRKPDGSYAEAVEDNSAEQALFETALKPSEGTSLEDRLAAVRQLGQLASAPSSPSAAEEALHELLQSVVGEGAASVRKTAELSLYTCWQISGDDQVDNLLAEGMALFEKQKLTESVKVFTDIIEMAPNFAESYHKRASAQFLLKEFDKSIADCERALQLKPRHFGCLTGIGICHHSREDRPEALRWFKQALRVHPHMEGPRLAVDRLELSWGDTVRSCLTPEIKRTAVALKERSSSSTAPSPSGLRCSWDMHHVTPAGEKTDKGFTYCFRAKVQNDGSSASPVRSIARFYLMRHENGDISPALSDVTDGATRFMLEPGQSMSLSWHVLTESAAEAAAGGLLLERPDRVCSDVAERFIVAELEGITPTAIPESEMERLRVGHLYMGRLDLRKMT
eukprot:TRINITY_DN104563_c0_g1_i1.p1 TRINITY_DN104563_c0_g1~~TRINITY_DN104563_c0_g1_i1.p1  ORF type:complete len:458 (-),score=94.79 TRINITY_DN104563_c0_g1_i1:124-1497(-)